MATKTINLSGQSDFATQQQDIDRQRKLAEMLQKEAITPDQGQMVSGWYVAPGKMQHLAKLANALIGSYAGSKADERQSQLNTEQNQALSQGLQNYQNILQGTPATSTQIVDDEYGPQTVNAPAVPGDRRAALAQLLESRHPILQQMGAQMMMTEPKKENAFGKIDPKDYTQESVGKFAQTQNFADLVPVRKMEAVNGRITNLYTTPEGTVIPKESNPYSDLVVRDAAGNIVPNAPLIQAKKDIARSGKTDVNLAVNTEKSFLNQIGEGVGKNVIDTNAKAQGALGTLNTVNQIRDAINTGKIIAGPGADARVYLGQIGQTIGVGGKDVAEQLLNTRQLIQGLAQLELDGAQQMKGQGQITEGERDIVRRAASGEIGKLTAPEINILMDTLEKTSRAKISANQRNVQRLGQNKNAAPVVDFLSVEQPAPYTSRQLPPIPQPNMQQSGGGLSPQEMQELQQLRARFKR